MPRFPLVFGMAATAFYFEGSGGPPAISEYRVEGSTYPVQTSQRDQPWAETEQVGEATVGGDAGGRWVEFDPGSARNPRFYSVWRVDDQGVARLNRVLLVTDD